MEEIPEQANGRSVLIDRFAAVWATAGQRLCLKAVMADIAEIVVHSVCTSFVISNIIIVSDILRKREIIIFELTIKNQT